MTSRNLDELPYVFIVGFNKTATTSLHKLFEASGFPSVHWDGGRLAFAMLANASSDRLVFTGYDDRFRVFSDLMFRTPRFRFEGNSLFRTMDADYPGARFVYNFRNLEDWLESRAAHAGTLNGETLLAFEMRMMRTTDRAEVFQKWTNDRLALERDLRAHFAGRDGLLELDVADDDVPGKLSRFIGIDLDGAHWRRYNPRGTGAA